MSDAAPDDLTDEPDEVARAALSLEDLSREELIHEVTVAREQATLFKSKLYGLGYYITTCCALAHLEAPSCNCDQQILELNILLGNVIPEKGAVAAGA